MSKMFHILKGWHYSNFLPRFIRNKHVSVAKTIIFTKSCEYTVNEPSCVNKLFGYTHGIFGVHKNSDRFGWTWSSGTGKFCLWLYAYRNGQLKKKLLCSDLIACMPYRMFIITYDMKGTWQTDYYMDGKLVATVPIDKSKKNHVTLGFYFGGKSKAPHDMYIYEK